MAGDTVSKAPFILLWAAATLAAALAVTGVAAQQRGALPPEEEFALMPDAPGKEDVFYRCSACHSVTLVVQQGMTRDFWEETFDVMVGERGMEPLDRETRTQMLDYLAKFYGPDRKAASQRK
jgi:hypothetical protein